MARIIETQEVKKLRKELNNCNPDSMSFKRILSQIEALTKKPKIKEDEQI
ncbi:MAG: hypothetical protein PF569_04635 [Candidatus Woesearchaeota archaeon]|jgi:hypothetical protein|nr:hypothetical protein [Candidatus Woesearchaeota archaeon]